MSDIPKAEQLYRELKKLIRLEGMLSMGSPYFRIGEETLPLSDAQANEILAAERSRIEGEAERIGLELDQ